MPNFVRNILYFDGENVQAVFDFVSSKDSVFDFNKIIPEPENIADWYGWRVENWGTKWNAVDAEIIDDGVMFDTAWSAPLPVIKKLSELFPKIKLNVTCSDEDAGENCGQITYKNGVESDWYYPDRAKEIAEIYEECWGMPPFEEECQDDEIE